MTTYQRLRKENLELKRDLIIIATQPNSSSANLILMKWRIASDFEMAAMFGEPTESNTTNGILNQINETINPE